MINRIISITHDALKRPSAYHDSLWYESAAQWINELAHDYNLPHEAVAGFVAALSPLNSWDSQLKYTPPAITAAIQGKPIPGPGWFANKDKAARCVQGENPLDVLGGDKVRAFYRNLCGDDQSVTIDRHAIGIAGFSSKSADVGKLTSGVYARISFAFTAAARHFNLPPANLQALTWCYWRELNT